MNKKLHALIVDDSEDDTLLIARELRQAGYDLSYDRVDTPEEMRAALCNKAWDVILVDYKMPHFTGIDALKIAREKLPDIPFILVSGVIVEEMAVEAMRRGANDCIKKDNLERLTPTIARELQSANERKERKIVQTLLAQKNAELSVANMELMQLNNDLETINKELSESQREVLEKNEMLNESRRKLAALIEDLPGIVYRCINDKDWTMEFVSSGCREITGYEPDEIIQNKVISFNNIIFKDDRDMVHEQVQNGAGKNELIEIRYRIVSKSGNIIWVWEKARGIYDGDNLVAFEGFISDISELIRKDEQIKQIQKMEVIGTLAGGLAHDFNNILGGIMGSADLLWRTLLKEELKDIVSIKKYMTTIKNASSRASELIKQLLLLSRKHEQKLSPVDLNASVRNVIAICQGSFPKSIELKWELFFKPAIVMADQSQLEPAILNLCVNASHAMTLMRKDGEAEGGILTVRVNAFTADAEFCKNHPDAREGCNYYVIIVSDTGVGIDADKIDRIFEPFFTTKKGDEGSGLGLSIVYSVIKQYDGFMKVSSETGSGTSFRIYIPQVSANACPGEDYDEVDLKKGSGVVLVVDDEEIMRNIAADGLKECGYEVITAENGSRALEIYRNINDRIDIVFLDLSMPGISGKAVFAEMKKISPGVKVILTSGFGADEKIKDMHSIGINGFLQKPYKLEDLALMMSKVLRNQK